MSIKLPHEYLGDPQMRAVAIGLDVEHFVEHTSVGQYLVNRAEEMRQQALESWVDADPNDVKRMIEMQWEAKIPGLLIQWLNEAVANGRAEEENIAIEEALSNKF